MMPADRKDRTLADYAALPRAARRLLKGKTGIMLRGTTKPHTKIWKKESY